VGAAPLATDGQPTGNLQVFDDETYLPTFQAAPRAYARISRPDENRRRPQGSVGAPSQGSRQTLGLTLIAPAPRIGNSRYRLRGVGAFEAVFRTGTRHDARYLQLIAAPAAQPPGRVGYVIGRKVMPRAVDRNRLRRCLREMLRAARPALEAFDVILRVKRSVARTEIDLVLGEAQRLLARLPGSADSPQ
jgi:ribonuclease P protein component